MYNKIAVLVPPCLLAPNFQVSPPPNQWRELFFHLFMAYNIDIIPYTCSESTFNGYDNGLLRKAHGIDYYQSLNGYEEYCKSIAEKNANQVCAMVKGGYIFAAILGIEHSPSCAVNYIYTCRGMEKRSGLFISALKTNLTQKGILIPYVGINRKFPQKSIHLLDNYFKNTAEGNSIQ